MVDSTMRGQRGVWEYDGEAGRLTIDKRYLALASRRYAHRDVTAKTRDSTDRATSSVVKERPSSGGERTT